MGIMSRTLLGLMLLGVVLFSVIGSSAEDKTVSKKQRPVEGPKWDTSNADAAEKESKRSEVWPHGYTPPSSVTVVRDVIYG
jgi:hypothetical protein